MAPVTQEIPAETLPLVRAAAALVLLHGMAGNPVQAAHSIPTQVKTALAIVDELILQTGVAIL